MGVGVKGVSRYLRPVVLSLVAGGLFAAVAFGQGTDGVLVGTIMDSSGASVPGAAVTAVNKDTGVKYNSTASAVGSYRLNNIPIGRYDVSASAKGFATATVANVVLELNHTATVDVSLAVGSVSTTVEVTEAATAIDMSTAQVQTAYDTRSAIDLPAAGFSKTIGGAGIYNLSLLGAGVASAGGVGQGVGPSVGGQRPENNSFNIDGVMNDAHYSTGPQLTVSNEAIAELNVMQNQFSAEFGGASGGVFNSVVKTGTNELHGSVYEYMQNRNLNAVDYSQVLAGYRTNQRYDNNRIGATIGGHIIKNKLFYFGDFEYNPLGQSAAPGQTTYAPTAAGLALLNGMSGINKTNLGIFEKYVPVAPAATNDFPVTVKGVSIPTGPLSFASPAYANTYNAAVSIDWNVSAKDQLRARFFYNNSQPIDTNAQLPLFYQPNPTIAKSGSLSEFHNFGPTLENEARVSYIRYFNSITAGDFKFPGLDAFPNIQIDDLNTLQIGPDPNTPSGSIENDATFQDNLTKSWGRHTFKAGFQFTDIILDGNFVQRARGDYDYLTFERYLLDQSPDDLGERSAGAQNGVPFGFLQTSAYINDDFRVTPKFTLNLGLRYEYVTVPVGSRAQKYSSIASVPGVITFAEPKPGKNDWSPRLGFAYSPGTGGFWSIRGGVSRAFDNTYINLNQNSAPAYYMSTLDVDPSKTTSNFLAGGGLSGAIPSQGTQADARAAVASYTFDQTRPYTLTGSLSVERRLGKDYTIEARYLHTKGVHLWNQTRLNFVAPVTASASIPTFLSVPSAAQLASLKTTLGSLLALPNNDMAQYGLTSNITGYHPWGNSRYDGLALQVTKRYSKNFQYLLAYTWSHNFDDSTATNFSTILSPRRAQDFQNMRAEWASSALDRRQRLTITPVYDFKPFQDKGYLLKNVVGNWNISATYTFQSPEYTTVQSGLDSNLNGDTAGDRSIINPAGVANTGSGVIAYNAAGAAVGSGTTQDPTTVAYVAAKPNAQYIQAGYGARANSGRNTMPLDHTNNVDLSLTKRLNLNHEGNKSVQIGIGTFNLFNHSQFVGGYLSDVSTYTTDAVSRSFLNPSSGSFNGYQQFFPSNSRTAQLTARFVF